MSRREKRAVSKFDPQLVAESFRLFDEGVKLMDIAAKLDKAHTTVIGWLDKYRDGDASIEGSTLRYGNRIYDLDDVEQEVPLTEDTPKGEWLNDEMGAMEQAAKRFPAYREQVVENDRPDVPPQWTGDDDPAELWRMAEKKNERAVTKAIHRSKFDVKLGNDPVGICFVSDQHISAQNSVCLKRMREDAELIASTDGLFACLGGDGVDNHVKHRSALLAARSTPGDQWLLYEYYMGLFAHKILAMISGNHDAWTEGFAGLDMVNWIAKKNRICYAPAEAHLNVDVGGCDYLISFRHQYRMNSSFNETHAVKQWLRHGDTPFDVGCVCHHHTPAMEECLIMGEHRIFCRPGSYQITSSPSRQYGYNLTTPTCPTVVFYPGERRLVGFYSVQDAAKWLKIELGK